MDTITERTRSECVSECDCTFQVCDGRDSPLLDRRAQTTRIDVYMGISLTGLCPAVAKLQKSMLSVCSVSVCKQLLLYPFVGYG